MKKKKFFSYLFLGLLAVGATGTVTSCKDYDDDIDNLQKQVTDLGSSLDKTKSDLETEISNLKTELTNKDAELQALIQTAQTAANNAQSAADKAQQSADKAQQSADNAQSAADKAQQAANANAATINDEILRAKAAEAALETRIDAAEKTLTSLNNLIATVQDGLKDKADQKALNDSIANVYTSLEAVRTNLGDQLKTATQSIDELKGGLNNEKLAREAVEKDLAQQKEALSKLQEQLKGADFSKYLTTTDKTELEKKISDAQETLQNEINTLNTTTTANSTDIETLKKSVENIYNQITAINNEIAVLNVFVSGQLRSLVFIPQSYYYGIEATEVFSLKYFTYTDFSGANWKVADADTNEPVGYTKSERYKNQEGSTSLPLTAHYHMNPGIADEPDDVTILDADKQYITSRASAAGITTKSFKKNGEQLDVTLKFANPEAVKNIPNDQLVTVFAAQAHYKTGTKDTTVTSDYAAVYKTTATDVVLAKTTTTKDKLYTGVKNDTKTNFPTRQDNLHSTLNDAAQSHLIPSEFDALRLDPQDKVAYNQTVDLNTLVEVHYVKAGANTESTMSAKDLSDYGLALKFELTGSHEGGNTTSEAAHAGIKNGIFRAQIPQRDGKAYSWDAYDAHKASFSSEKAYDDSLRAHTVGRQPIVRFSLIDTNNGNRVIDYGYIKIKFVDESETPSGDKNNVTISYTGTPLEYNSDCAPKDWTFKTTWNQIEYDVLAKLQLDKKAFDEAYENDGHLVLSTGNVKQFNPATVRTTTATEASELNPYIGTVIDNYDSEGSETQTFTWTIPGSYIEKQLYGKQSHAPFTIAILYKSKNVKVNPDLYVILSTGAITIKAPSGEFLKADGSDRIREYWYKDNGNGATEFGLSEIHANTLSPEDPHAGTVSSTFEDTFSDTFYGNAISLANVSDVTNNKDFASSKRLYNFVFSTKNNNKVVKGYVDNGNGKAGYSEVTWTLQVSADGKTLQAVKKNGTNITPETVAKISADDPANNSWTTATGIKDQKAVYDGPTTATMSEAAQSIVNYRAHNELNDDVLKAIVALKVKTNVCEHELALTNNEFNVRFLRPVNVKTTNKDLEDAQDKKQVIYLKDLVSFTDWRDYAFASHASYFGYYNIQNIKVVGATAQGVDDNNPTAGLVNNYIYTTMTKGGENNASLNDKITQATVSNQLRFFNVKGSGTGNDQFGHLLYENLSSTVQSFTVRVPLEITYNWGKLYTTVDINIKNTHANSKRN